MSSTNAATSPIADGNAVGSERRTGSVRAATCLRNVSVENCPRTRSADSVPRRHPPPDTHTGWAGTATTRHQPRGNMTMPNRRWSRRFFQPFAEPAQPLVHDHPVAVLSRDTIFCPGTRRSHGDLAPLDLVAASARRPRLPACTLVSLPVDIHFVGGDDILHQLVTDTSWLSNVTNAMSLIPVKDSEPKLPNPELSFGKIDLSDVARDDHPRNRIPAGLGTSSTCSGEVFCASSRIYGNLVSFNVRPRI